jgi:hypothetical protein
MDISSPSRDEKKIYGQSVMSKMNCECNCRNPEILASYRKEMRVLRKEVKDLSARFHGAYYTMIHLRDTCIKSHLDILTRRVDYLSKQYYNLTKEALEELPSFHIPLDKKKLYD